MTAVYVQDECVSADDVRSRAKATAARRRAFFARRDDIIEPATEELPPPVPAPRPVCPAAAVVVPVAPQIAAGPLTIGVKYSLDHVAVVGRFSGTSEPLTFSISVMIGSPPLPTLRLEDIRRAVCREVGISLNEFVSSRRNRRLTVPRQIFAMLAANLTKASFPMLGKMAGDRDHTTMMHGAAKLAFLFPQIAEVVGVSRSATTWARAAVRAHREFEDQNGGRAAWRTSHSWDGSVAGARVPPAEIILPWPFNLAPANDQ